MDVFDTINIVSYIRESDMELKSIFDSISINESEMRILREASLRDIFRKVKEFFKNLITKVLDIFKKKFRAASIRNMEFYKYCEKNKIAISAALDGIKYGEIRLDGKYNLFLNFSPDAGARFGSGSGFFKLDQKDIDYLSRYTIRQEDQIDIEDLEEWTDKIKAESYKKIFSSFLTFDYKRYAILDFDSADFSAQDLETLKGEIKEFYMGSPTKLDASNVETFSINLNAIKENRDEFSDFMNRYIDLCKEAYEKAIRDLNNMEKEMLTNTSVIEENVPKAVSVYSTMFKDILNAFMNISNFIVELRAQQVLTYYQILKKLVSMVFVNSESSIFSEVELL